MDARQLLISPILMAEQLVTEKDTTAGVTTVKMGAVFNLIEPLTLSERLGNRRFFLS